MTVLMISALPPMTVCALVWDGRTLGAFHMEETEHSGSKEREIVDTGVRLLGAHRRIQSIDRLLVTALMLTI